MTRVSLQFLAYSQRHGLGVFLSDIYSILIRKCFGTDTLVVGKGMERYRDCPSESHSLCVIDDNAASVVTRCHKDIEKESLTNQENFRESMHGQVL